MHHPLPSIGVIDERNRHSAIALMHKVAGNTSFMKISYQCAFWLLLGMSSHVYGNPLEKVDLAILSELRNIALEVKYTLVSDTGVEKTPQYRTCVYRHYASNSGLIRLEVEYFDDQGASVDQMILSFDGNHTAYYDANNQTISLTRKKDLKSFVLDQATRFSFFPFLFLFPNRDAANDPSTGEYPADYDAAKASDLFDRGLWTLAQANLRLVSSPGTPSFYEMFGQDNFSTPKTISYRFYRDANISMLPYRVEKLSSDGTLLQHYNVLEWKTSKLTIANGENISFAVPSKATLDMNEDKTQIRAEIEVQRLTTNDPKLDDPDFYTVDVSIARQVFDSDENKMLMLPR